jgi:hypothetical protein
MPCFEQASRKRFYNPASIKYIEIVEKPSRLNGRAS